MFDSDDARDSTTLAAFLEAAPDAVVLIDDTGQIVVANGRAATMFGYAEGELVGQAFDVLVPGEGPWDQSDGVIDLSARRKDGSELPIEARFSPLQPSARRLVIGILREATERRHAAAKFRGLLESAPDAMLVVDQTGAIVIVNGQTERIFGYSRGELIGRPIELLVPRRFERLHGSHRAGYFEAPKTRPMGSASMTLSGRRRDGSEFPVEISLSPMQTDDGLLVTAAVRDITDRLHAETQLRNSLAEKEVLLKEVHHRVKNNLQVVSSLLNLQMSKITDPLALGLFRESQARVRSIGLFHEKLYQAKDLAHVDMSEYLTSLANGLFSAYGVGDITLRMNAQDVRLGVDAALACGLMVNELVSNAIKHAFPPGRVGTVEIVLRAEEEDYARLEVRDDGIGFPRHVDFRNMTSLGLKLVCILTAQVHGTIELDTDKGTAFKVRFPCGDHN